MGHGRAREKFLHSRPLISNLPGFEDEEGEEQMFCVLLAAPRHGTRRGIGGIWSGKETNGTSTPPPLLHARAAFLELPDGYPLRQTGLLAFFRPVLGRSYEDPEGPMFYLKCTFGVECISFTSTLSDSLTPAHLYFHTSISTSSTKIPRAFVALGTILVPPYLSFSTASLSRRYPKPSSAHTHPPP
jgi:hypothetical protein